VRGETSTSPPAAVHAVCEARSISRVAAQETIVASAISKRLTQLEEVVGAKLLQTRQGRRAHDSRWRHVAAACL